MCNGKPYELNEDEPGCTVSRGYRISAILSKNGLKMMLEAVITTLLFLYLIETNRFIDPGCDVTDLQIALKNPCLPSTCSQMPLNLWKEQFCGDDYSICYDWEAKPCPGITACEFEYENSTLPICADVPATCVATYELWRSCGRSFTPERWRSFHGMYSIIITIIAVVFVYVINSSEELKLSHWVLILVTSTGICVFLQSHKDFVFSEFGRCAIDGGTTNAATNFVVVSYILLAVTVVTFLRAFIFEGFYGIVHPYRKREPFTPEPNPIAPFRQSICTNLECDPTSCLSQRGLREGATVWIVTVLFLYLLNTSAFIDPQCNIAPYIKLSNQSDLMSCLLNNCDNIPFDYLESLCTVDTQECFSNSKCSTCSVPPESSPETCEPALAADPACANLYRLYYACGQHFTPNRWRNDHAYFIACIIIFTLIIVYISNINEGEDDDHMDLTHWITLIIAVLCLAITIIVHRLYYSDLPYGVPSLVKAFGSLSLPEQDRIKNYGYPVSDETLCFMPAATRNTLTNFMYGTIGLFVLSVLGFIRACLRKNFPSYQRNLKKSESQIPSTSNGDASDNRNGSTEYRVSTLPTTKNGDE